MFISQVAGSLAMQIIVNELEELLLCLLIAIAPVPEQFRQIWRRGSHVGGLPSSPAVTLCLLCRAYAPVNSKSMEPLSAGAVAVKSVPKRGSVGFSHCRFPIADFQL